MSEPTEKEIESTEPAIGPFASLGLNATLSKTLADLGYEAATPIQERTIPLLLDGKDVIGQAQTGTGKTAAFALPMLQKIDISSKQTQALVLAPTRELAMQVAEAIHSYSRGLGSISVLPVYGGAPMGVQLKALSRGVQIVVGTPGRLIDHLDRKTLDLARIRMIVLDEADEMLKMGFQEEVERILSSAPEERQVALFSATMPEEVLRISKRYLRNPTRIEIEHKAQNTPAIEQRFLNVSEGQKLEVLTQILELEPSEAVLIFKRTKNGAAELAERLETRGFAAEAMHGDMTQPMRESVIRRLRSGQLEIVVATDVAARGLDVEQISHVINYDIPHDVEAYVHRIGRTGRAGRTGLATLFITPRERRMMREIERFTGMPIKPMKMPTSADVADRRIGLFKENLRKNLELGDLDLYVELVEKLVDEGGFDMAEVAAAAARMANSSRSLQPEAAPHPAASRPSPSDRAPQQDERTAADPRGEMKPRREAFAPKPRGPHDRPGSTYAPTSSRKSFPGDDEPKVRLSMAVGSRDGIRPGDIVGSIANEADVPGKEIGPIDIGEERTIVVIPAKYQDQVLAKVAGARFRGRSLDIRVASENDQGSFSRTPRREDEASFARSRPAAHGDRNAREGRPGRPASLPYRGRDTKPYGTTSSRPPSDSRPPFRKNSSPGPDNAARERLPFRSDRPAFRPAGGSHHFTPRGRSEGSRPAGPKKSFDGAAPGGKKRPTAGPGGFRDRPKGKGKGKGK